MVMLSTGYLVLGLYFNNCDLYFRWWVRPINVDRCAKGAFRNLFDEIKNTDGEMFFKYTRMTPDQFDTLLALVRPKLLKRSRRKPLSPGLRLAMTIK